MDSSLGEVGILVLYYEYCYRFLKVLSDVFIKMLLRLDVEKNFFFFLEGGGMAFFFYF